MKISFIVPSYNNLRYLKNAYHSIRTWESEEHEIVILDDASVDGTAEWLDSLNDPNLIIWKNETGKRMGHTITYDIGVNLSTNDIFGIFHADMFLGENYVKNIVKHLERGKVVTATRVEPPLHPSGREKITRDFGVWPEDFREDDFIKFVREEQERSKDQITKGIFAPWYMYKEDYLKIGGHDHLFAPFPYEDSDIFQRFLLAGYEVLQSRDALVYHLTCRGHKWTDDDIIGKVDDDFEELEVNARKNFIRKWNSWIMNDEWMHPIMIPKYNTCLIADNVESVEQLDNLEPWFCHTVIDSFDLVAQYLYREQPNTTLDMSERISSKETEEYSNYGVKIYIDLHQLTPDEYGNLGKMNLILDQLNKNGSLQLNLSGEYQLGNIKVQVDSLDNIVDGLIMAEPYNE
jgi:glycosyltransferase involved in cell wall biosynthesis